MQLISCHNGKIHALGEGALRATAPNGSFRTGLRAIDGLLPNGAFARGAVHELLFDPAGPRPLFFAALLARCAAFGGEQETGWGDGMIEWTGGDDAGDDASPSSPPAAPGANPPAGAALVWLDPAKDIYPPALAAMGVPLDRLFLVRSPIAEQAWAVAECLRCKGVGAVVAAPQRLSRVDARRLQLAAEQGGGVGLFLRPAGRASADYAAATRWLVAPAASAEATVQRWKIQLVHGHGGRVGGTVLLEYCRETRALRASEQLADRPRQPAARPRREAVGADVDVERELALAV